jgi:peptide/nickel transport system permease protein
VVVGSRVSLLVAVSSVLMALCIGGAIGLLSAYRGGYFDILVQRAVDVLMSFPSIVLAMLIVAALGRGLYTVIIAIAAYNMAYFSRLVRAQVLQVKNELYVESAHAIGASPTRILLRHITPNILMPLIVMGTMRLSTAVLTEASLSYLGLGIPPPSPSWGNIVADGQKYIFTAPWISIFGGAAVMVSVLGLNLLGDRLRDVFDPRLRGG